MEAHAEILFDDGGILVKYADGDVAAAIAMMELRNQGYTAPGEAEEHVARLEPISRYWRKVPASKEDGELFGYTWVLRPAERSAGAFYGTWFRRPI